MTVVCSALLALRLLVGGSAPPPDAELSRPLVDQPEPRPKAQVRSAPKARPIGASHKGWAKVDEGQGVGHAAAGPALRAWLGPHWRGTTVIVSKGDRSVTVRLTDWCGCTTNPASIGLIDMDEQDFKTLTGHGPGKAWVRIRRAG